jgi:hypothetical protein
MPTRCCWIVGLAALQADQFDDLERARLARRAPHALHLQGKGDVAEHGQMGQQGEMLEHHAHAMPADLDQLLLGGGEQVLAFEHDPARGRLDQARHAAHQRRLAGARKAHDDEDLAFVNVEAGVAHGADQAGAGQLLVADLAAVLGEEGLGARSENLPDGLAGELDASLSCARATLTHHCLPGGVAYYGIM